MSKPERIEPVPLPPEAQARLLADDEIDLRELAARIWSGKGWILLCTLLFGLASGGWAWLQPNIYKSEALLAPADSSGQGGLGALAAQFGGLASLAGVSLPAGKADSTDVALEVLKSRAFLVQFIRKHQIEVPLMAAKGWDMQSGKLILDPAIYDAQTGQWTREVNPPRKPEPSDQELYEALKKILATRQDKQNGLVTLSIEHVSPVLAKQWVDWLVKDINAHMRERDVQDAQKQIDYLKSQLAQTQLADLQKVFYSLIEQNTKVIMLANVRDEYAFKTLDPAVVPEQKVKPKRALILALGVVLGGMVGVFIALLRSVAIRDEVSK